ncbi:proteasome regulatory particle subunit, partial [Ascosphaera acerosa]
SLQGLHLRLRDIAAYLRKVLDGALPVNHAILAALQDIFNLLPNLALTRPPPATTAPPPASSSSSTPDGLGTTHPLAPSEPSGTATPVGLAPAAASQTYANNNDVARAMSIKINDQLMSIHVSSLIRAITAFHDLIENKIQNLSAVYVAVPGILNGLTSVSGIAWALTVWPLRLAAGVAVRCLDDDGWSACKQSTSIR